MIHNIRQHKKNIFIKIYCLVILCFFSTGIISCGGNRDDPANYLPQADEFMEVPESFQTLSSEKWHSYNIIGNWYMDTRLCYIMDTIWFQMGTFAEIVDTASRIRHTSELSWYREWTKTAQRVEQYGDESLKQDHAISAGQAYLRAANYYIAAEVFLHTNPEDSRILQTFKKGATLFEKGQRLLGSRMETVYIPYQEISLKGYFFPAGDGAPLIIFHQGYDAPLETSIFTAQEANRRGYHCLMFEGQGQGLTIREHRMPFAMEWEKPVGAVIDYALANYKVDSNKIILIGTSMGGGLAIRAAAFEKRLAVCVANPAYLNFYDMFVDMLGEKIRNLYESDPEEFNNKIKDLAQMEVGFRWGLNHGMWVFGAETPDELFVILKQYDNKPILSLIDCFVVIMDGEDEAYGKGQSKMVYDLLPTEDKYLMYFEEESTASIHCQTGNPAVATQRLFDWLDEYSQ